MVNAEQGINVLLGSGGISTEARRNTYRELTNGHFSGCSEVLFLPYASLDHSDYSSKMRKFLGEGGTNLVGIETKSDPVSAIECAEAIYVGGGNSFLLVKELHDRGLIAPIREAVHSRIPYLGVSAGANVASPTMMTTNDMPIVHPATFESLGVVPFQINPHYHPGKIKFLDGDALTDHFGESRSQRIAEFHRIHDTPVLGMWEGSFIQWDGETGRLTGRATAFIRGEEPRDLSDGTEFDGQLG